jgi:hypothetical protein
VSRSSGRRQEEKVSFRKRFGEILSEGKDNGGLREGYERTFWRFISCNCWFSETRL